MNDPEDVMIRHLSIAALIATLPVAAAASDVTCYGDADYRICTKMTQRPDGGVTVETTDSHGKVTRVEFAPTRQTAAMTSSES